MEWNSKIGEKDITIRKNTLEINDSIEEANTSSFSYINEDYSPVEITQPVEIKADNNYKFKGYVSNISQTIKSGGQLKAEVDCQGQDYLLKKRIITKAFENKTVAYIIQFMVDNVLNEEGITVGTINADTVIEKIAFNSITCYDALDQLIMFGDYIWNIDNEKKINFIEISDNRAPYDLDFTDNNCIALNGNYTIDQDASNYRNSITLQGVKGLSPRTEYFTGDGNTRTWNTKLKIHNIIGLWVDYNDGHGFVAETFAPNTEANGHGQYAFLYDEGNNQVQQYEDSEDSSLTPALTSDNTLKVSYNGTYALTLKYNNFEEIYKQQGVDGTSGINEAVEEVEISGLSAALQYARQNIEKNKKKGYKLTFITDKEGLEALQTIHVVLPQLRIDNDFLITNVSCYEQDIILYEVSIVDGDLRDSYLTELFGDKEKFKTDLKQQDSQDTANVNITFEKTWTESETPNIFSTGPTPSNDLFPSDSLYPGYPGTDRIKFIQLYKTVGNTYSPFLRIPIAGDELADNGNTYISIAIIDDTVSFSELCTHIAWVACNGAVMPTEDDFTSGNILAEADVDVPFDKVQDLEVITVLRIDTKWEEEVEE